MSTLADEIPTIAHSTVADSAPGAFRQRASFDRPCSTVHTRSLLREQQPGSVKTSYQMTSDSRKLVVCTHQARKLERIAGWVGAGLASAFFASLERCSCITLNTIDAEDDEEGNDTPLIPVNRESVHQERWVRSEHAKRKQIAEDRRAVST